jgi:hypothetical protein
MACLFDLVAQATNEVFTAALAVDGLNSSLLAGDTPRLRIQTR